MSVRENERRARQRRQSLAQDFDLPPLPDDNEVLIFPDWCRSNAISVRTGRKLKAAGKGPIFTQVSDRRFGVTKRNNRIWQAQRAR